MSGLNPEECRTLQALPHLMHARCCQHSMPVLCMHQAFTSHLCGALRLLAGSPPGASDGGGASLVAQGAQWLSRAPALGLWSARPGLGPPTQGRQRPWCGLDLQPCLKAQAPGLPALAAQQAPAVVWLWTSLDGWRRSAQVLMLSIRLQVQAGDHHCDGAILQQAHLRGRSVELDTWLVQQVVVSEPAPGLACSEAALVSTAQL